jgi:hypothetical protein
MTSRPYRNKKNELETGNKTNWKEAGKKLENSWRTGLGTF